MTPIFLPAPGGLLKAPLEHCLTRAIRRLAAGRPGLFERLGSYRSGRFLLVPSGFPFAFRLEPDGARATVRVVPARWPGPYTVRIAGELSTLIGLFDGSCDADSAFFSRRIRVDGATDAALALHNTLEAAGLEPSDVLGLEDPVATLFNRAFVTMGKVLHARA